MYHTWLIVIIIIIALSYLNRVVCILPFLRVCLKSKKGIIPVSYRRGRGPWPKTLNKESSRPCFLDAGIFQLATSKPLQSTIINVNDSQNALKHLYPTMAAESDNFQTWKCMVETMRNGCGKQCYFPEWWRESLTKKVFPRDRNSLVMRGSNVLDNWCT